ncbi:hypothetical protein [Syntrophobacter fumaroxidans]|uniref:hypothetical protein n=1 Tax=Syntrophobacter fumaroxidans TaxID=119484 RepID=UPI0012378DAE|nr:hypothetical protein [Syntrophobacter fumaroxidans]
MSESSLQSWQIEQQCPQCGAPLVLEETDRVLSCEFCRVKLTISFPGHCRCYLPPARSRPDLLFIPYWRFKGMVFSSTEEGVRARIVDSNQLAVNSLNLPPSLGLRPQVMRLKFAAPKPEGRFIKPGAPVRVFSMKVDDTFQGASERISRGLYEAFIGETVSAIYTPVFVEGRTVLDAVLNRPLCAADVEDAPELDPDSSFDWPITFSSTLCPHCGWDLETERDGLVLLCRNCGSAWEHLRGELKRISFFLPLDSNPSAIHLPFWKLRTRFEGLQLDSFGDLVRLANMPKIARAGEADRDLHFLIPAFKIQPRVFLRLAKLLTSNSLDEGPSAEPGSLLLHPVTLPAAEAVESIKTILFAMVAPKRAFFPLLGRIRPRVEEYGLTYLPFVPKGHELVQPDLQTSINKNVLNWGRLI